MKNGLYGISAFSKLLFGFEISDVLLLRSMPITLGYNSGLDFGSSPEVCNADSLLFETQFRIPQRQLVSKFLHLGDGLGEKSVSKDGG